MNLSLIALVIYILFILLWNIIVKKHIVLGMLLSLLIISLFAGQQMPKFLITSLYEALQNEVIFASLSFIILSWLIKETEVIYGIIAIFNSLFGKIKGGPAFVNIGISALFGMLSGSNSANTATSGTFTSDWMIETGWKPEYVATLIAGNGGLGAGFPPSASMFIMLGFGKVNGLISEEQLYIGLFVSGIYQVLYRVGLVLFLMRKQNITISQESYPKPTKNDWKSMLIFLGALVPVYVKIFGLKALGLSHLDDHVSLLFWLPTFMLLMVIILGWKKLKEKSSKLEVSGLISQFSSTGCVLLFAFAGSGVLSRLGLIEHLKNLFTNLKLPQLLIVLFVALMVVVIAGPLSSTATLTSIGFVAFSALHSAGVSPLAAVVAILVFASTEGASPPASGSIFIASSLAGVSPEKIFSPLIIYFVIPILLIGVAIAMGFLPLFV